MEQVVDDQFVLQLTPLKPPVRRPRVVSHRQTMAISTVSDQINEQREI